MDSIRFIGTTGILSVGVSLVGNRIKLNTPVIPTDEELACGFEILNEHNGVVQADYSEYKYVYDKGQNYVILTTDSKDVYIAPKYANIYYVAGEHGRVSAESEKIQINADEITVKGAIAYADTGYTFKNWTDGNGTIISEESNFVPSVPTADVTYTANFTAIVVPEKTLDEVKAIKSSEMDSDYSIALATGTSATLSDGSTISFSITQDFINDASAAFNLASALYGTDGITVPFEINKVCYQYTPLDVIYIYIAMQIYIVACKSLRNELLATIERCETKEAAYAVGFELECLDATGLLGYQTSMASGQTMIDVLKAKFGIADTTVTEETTSETATE